MGKIAAIVGIATMVVMASPAHSHTCGNQATDNRPNHCVTNGVHRGSTCTVSTAGGRTCTYTHCDGVTTSVSTDPNCCCVDYRPCTQGGVPAQYWAICLGGAAALVEQTEPDESAGGTDPPPTYEGNTSAEPPAPVTPAKKTCASCNLASRGDGGAAVLLVATVLLAMRRRRHRCVTR